MFWPSTVSDLKLAIRSGRKSPLTFGAIVLCLALGIGANMAVFSWANGFVIRPIPGASRTSELVVVDGLDRSGADQRLSFPDYRDLRDRADVFSEVIVQTWLPMTLAGEEGAEHAERIAGEIVSASFFDALGVDFALGRGFQPEEDRGPGAHPVVVLSHAFWQRRFDGAPEVLGRTLRLNGRSFTVVGVAAEGFRGGITSLAFDVFVPVMMEQALLGGESRLEQRDLHWLGCWARLRPGVSLEAARAQVSSIASALERENPLTNQGEGLAVFALWNAPWGATNVMRPLLGVLSAVTGLVLLIACVNVAQLLLARGLERRRELALLSTLGASRAMLVRKQLVEAAVLSTAASVLGVAAGMSSAGLLQALVPPTRFPVRFDFAFEPSAIVFGVVLAVVTTLLFGPLPALRVSRRIGEASEIGASRSGSAGVRRKRSRSTLVVAQVALSMLLLATSGLFLRALQTARSVPPGFDPSGLLLASVDLGSAGYDAARGDAFYRRLLEEVRSHPAVAGASYASRLPLDFGGLPTVKVSIEGYEPREDEQPSMGVNYVGPEFLATMKIPLARGRDFADEDRVEGAPVAIVNETAGKRYWGESDPVGRTLYVGEDRKRFTVVGVAKDAKYRDLYEGPTPYLYLSASQTYQPSLVLHVRGENGAPHLAEEVRRTAAGLDPAVALYDVRPMTEQLGVAVFQYRLASTLLLVFAWLSLALCAMGLYGVVSLGVSARVPEFGVRMAMGASRSDIVRLAVGEGLSLTLIGTAAGLLGAVAVSLTLPRVVPLALSPDPLGFATAAATLVAVSLLSSYGPARRASRLDPSVSMRTFAS